MEAFISFLTATVEKNTPLAFDTVEILNNNILCIIWGARKKHDKSLWSIFPRSLTASAWEEIYSSFSQSDSKLGSTGGKFNFFWIFLTGESVPSLHPAGEMVGRSASCVRETAETGPACPGDKNWRTVKINSGDEPASWEAQLELCEGWRDSACQGLHPHPGNLFKFMLILAQTDMQ